MGNRRFSATTYVLVGISLVALYFVGKIVNPPPPAPQKETPVATVPQPAAPTPAQSQQQTKMVDGRKAQEARNRAIQMQKMKVAAQNKSAVKADKFNPQQIDTGADYWHHHDMGKTGEVEMAAKVAAANAKSKAPAIVPHLQKTPTLPQNP